MKLGFNSSGNNQTSNRTTSAVFLGKLRNSAGSITRKFKFCNNNSNDMNSTFNCVFNNSNNNSSDNLNIEFQTYHILNNISNEVLNLETVDLNTEITDLNEETANLNEENDTDFKTFTESFRGPVIGPFTPLQIKNAYSISNILPVKGIRAPIVTIITAFNNPYLLNDVKKFGEIFKLPPCNIKIYNFSNTFNVGWAIETTLDVQWVYAINPYAEIRVIQAASSNFSNIMNAINFSNNKNNFNPKIDTDVLNMSFGMPDNGSFSSYNNYFTNNNTIYLAASGDSSIVSFPSSCTNILAIGGTTLKLNNNNTRFSERVWKSSGCGYSKSFIRPSYQPKLSNNNSRITPDVSCVADPGTGCYVVLNQKIYSVGGTSLSSPIYCGILSLLTQKRLNNNKYTFTSVSDKFNSIQPLLYQNNSNFFDITEGSSSSYNASKGFDIASGLGVVNVEKLLQSLG